MNSRGLCVKRIGCASVDCKAFFIMSSHQNNSCNNNNNNNNNNEDEEKNMNKDVMLLLIPSTESIPANSPAAAQQLFIDDLTMKKKDEKQRRLWRVPWFILLMCFVQISLHLIVNGCMQKRLIYQPESEYWRYFTYMLLHADTCHLSLNLCLQLFIGCSLELEQGHCRLALIYLLGGLCGSLAHSWLQPQLMLLGGSAGVYAMMSSHIPHLVLNFHDLSYRYVRILSLMILFMTDMGLTIYHFHYHLNRNPRISLEAHFGGGFLGLIGGFIIYRRIPSPTTFYSKQFSVVSN